MTSHATFLKTSGPPPEFRMEILTFFIRRTKVFQFSSIGLSSGARVGKGITQTCSGKPSSPSAFQRKSAKMLHKPPECSTALLTTMKSPRLNHPEDTALTMKAMNVAESWLSSPTEYKKGGYFVVSIVWNPMMQYVLRK